MLSIIFWASFGLIIGWIVTIIREIREPHQIALYLTTGVTGGLTGGFIGGLLDPTIAGYHTTTTDIIFAVFGATAFSVITTFILQRDKLGS